MPHLGTRLQTLCGNPSEIILFFLVSLATLTRREHWYQYKPCPYGDNPMTNDNSRVSLTQGTTLTWEYRHEPHSRTQDDAFR